jgi:predicted nucleic acid-binding Zn ribbon protein
MPQEKCPYCGSPIPSGSSTCKSCQMSGEILNSTEKREIKKKQKASTRLLLFLLVLALVVIASLGIAIYVRLHK